MSPLKPPRTRRPPAAAAGRRLQTDGSTRQGAAQAVLSRGPEQNHPAARALTRTVWDSQLHGKEARDRLKLYETRKPYREK